MNYRELEENLKPFVVFSIHDILKLDPEFHRQRLSEWQRKGYLRKITKGYYLFSDVEMEEPVLFLIANTIYWPSYVSLEMALSYHGLIPESVYSVTSVTTRVTKRLASPLGAFSYRKIKPELMFGYTLLPYGKHTVRIAEPEKALLDYFYFHADVREESAFRELRVNPDTLQKSFDREKFLRYRSLFGNRLLEKRTDNFLTFIRL